MAKEIKVPGIGPVKSTWVWAGTAVIAAILGYAYYRHKQNAAAGTTTADTTQATTDPATGYPSGSPEDTAALAAQAGGGYGSAGGGYYGSGSGYSGQQMYYDPADGLYDLTSPYTGTATVTGTTGTSGATANTGPGTFTDNAYWVQYAITSVQGYSAADIQGALSAYLSGLGLTTTQMSIYQAAIAVAGPPPQPPSQPAHLATQSATGSPGASGGAITVAPSGLHVTHVYTNSAQVAWSALHPPAGQGPVSGYGVECYDSAGNVANGPFTVSPGQLYANIGSLRTKTAYHVNVWADPAKTGGPHATVSFTTT